MSRRKAGERGEKGDGCIRKTKAGTYEGTYYIHKKDETEIRKSFTRDNRQQVKDIIAHLKVLEPIDNDIVKVEINKITDEIKLIRKSDLLIKKTQKLNKDMLVDDYVDYWLWYHRKKGQKGQIVKDSTFENYVEKGNVIKRKIGQIELEDNRIQKVKVKELTFDFIESKLLELFNETCKTTAVQTRNHIFNMMKWAKKDGVIEENPLADEIINFPISAKYKRKIIEETDIDKVIEHCLKFWYVDVLTQLMTGARISEIRGLCWEDIDEDKCEIHFKNNYVTTAQYELDNNGHIVQKGTKSDYSTLKSSHSYRIINVDISFMQILKLHKFLQKQIAERKGIEFKETDPVFTGRWYGKQLGKNTTNERIKRIVEDLKIKNWEEISSHCLRKSFCCAGILNDVPLEYMSQLMGHSSTKVTEEYYSEYKQEKINSYAKQTNKNRVIALQKINKGYSVPGKAI